MKFINNLPLKHKLLFGILATCLAALSLACTALFWFQSAQFRKGFVTELESLGAIIARNSAAPLAFGDKKSAVEVLAALKLKPQITSARVFDSEGKPFARFGEDPTVAEIGRGASQTEVTFDHGYAVLSLPIQLDDARPGRLELHARFADQYRRLLSLYGAVMAVVFAGSLGVILLMSSALQRIITGPIVALAGVARNISEQEDYSARAHEAGRDEVGLLTRTFNRMLDQIQSRDARLRESQQRYEVAVMGSSDGLWDWDLVTNAVFFSPRWKSIIGYLNSELEDELETFRKLLHPDDLGPVFEKVAAYLEGRDPSFEVEFRLRHHDGSYRWVLSRGAALWNEQGKPFRFAGSHTDITGRKQAETELRVSREKFQTLVNSIDGIVWEADLKTSTFTFVSQQAERLLGYPASRWLQEPTFWADHIHAADREATVRGCADAAAQRQVLRCEYRMIAADGREVWIRDVAAVTEAPDGALLLRGVLFDISDQKKAEQEMEQLNRQLRDASREAGMAEIATGVLHNVGNVLNSVNVSANLMVEQVRKSKTASLAKAVQLLSAHKEDVGEFLTRDPKGQQLPAFLEALSEHLTREQAGLSKELQGLQTNIEHIKQIVAMQQSYAKVSGALENLAPHELVEDALRMSSASLAHHRIELVREFEPVPPVLVDRHKVLQILVNLVSNAKHALDGRPEGRRLTVRIAHGENHSVRVEVRDNGAGIALENLTRIFQHGFTTKKSGHGFGLHSGANAAKELRGSLTAASEGPGLGATFILELPVGRIATQSSPAPADDMEQHVCRAAA